MASKTGAAIAAACGLAVLCGNAHAQSRWTEPYGWGAPRSDWQGRPRYWQDHGARPYWWGRPAWRAWGDPYARNGALGGPGSFRSYYGYGVPYSWNSPWSQGPPARGWRWQGNDWYPDWHGAYRRPGWVPRYGWAAWRDR